MKPFFRLLLLACVALATTAQATPTITINNVAVGVPTYTTGQTIPLIASPTGATINVTTAIGSSPGGTQVSSVEFFVNGASIGIVGGGAFGAYSFPWQPSAPGNYTLTARVNDTSVVTTGVTPNLNYATSPSVIVTVSATRVVTVAAPGSNTSFPQNSSTYFRSAVALSDKVVSSVQFYLDNALTPIGSPVTQAPYNAAVVLSNANGATLGAHNVFARATASDGATVDSALIPIFISGPVGTGPTMTLTAPSGSDTILVNQSVSVAATAVPAAGSFIPSTAGTGVTFFVDGDPIVPAGTGQTNPVLTSPYTLTWKPTQAKSYRLAALGVDDKGNVSLSSPVTVNVTAAVPTVTVTSPAGGTSLTVGTTYNITANATGANGAAVNNVTFYIDGVQKGAADTTAPFSTTWTPVVGEIGSHAITARVVDANSLTVTSATVNVTVASAPPTVALTTPTTGTTVGLGANVTLTATASGGTGASVSSVTFFVNGTQVGLPVTVGPYTVNWIPATSGAAAVTARVLDSNGTTVTSAPANVTVSAAGKIVNLVAPASGTTLPQGSTTYLRSTAAFTDGSAVSKVEFFLDGSAPANLIGTVTSTPFNLPFTFSAANGATIGAHTLFARATGNDASVTDSATATITVLATIGAAPTVTLTAPTTGGVVAINSNVTLTAAASDSDGFIPTTAPGGVTFYVDGDPITPTTGSNPTLTPPYSIVWKPTVAKNYVLQAQTVDDKGNLSLSNSVTVRVVAGLPTISVSAPASVVAGATANLTATAMASPGATVTSVSYYANGVLIGTATTGPTYALAWAPPTTGAHAITAQVTDSNGITVTSSSTNLNVTAAAPTITLTSPVAGSTLTVGTSTALIANPSPSTGALITKVDFYVGGSTLIGTATLAPYSFSWTPTTTGTFSLTAKITDSVGATATSAAASVNVVAATRMVTLVAPGNGTTLSEGSTLNLRSAVVVNDGAIVTKVDFYLGATIVGTATAAPYNVPYTFTPSGSYGLFARATFSDNTTLDSATATITVVPAVGTGPTVALTAPANGDTVALNSSVLLTATAAATNAGGYIPSTIPGGVTFFVDGDPVTPTVTGQTNPALTPPYTITWKPTVAKSYVLRAQTVDDKGNIRLSAPVTISVAPSVPTVTLTSPAGGAAVIIGNSVALAATASPSAGALVTKVEFLANNVVVGTVLTAPFSTTWTPAVTGATLLAARVTDSSGLVVTSGVVAINVMTPAAVTSVTITAPAAGTTFNLGSSVPLTVNATAAAGATVSRVDYFAGATQVATATAAPFSATWIPTTAGSVSLTAKVTDSAGTIATSAAVGVTVSSVGRLVTLVAPAAGSALAQGSATFLRSSVAVTDGSIIAKVDFYVDGAVVGTVTNAPYNLAYTFGALGAHTVFARATTTDGATSDSPTAAITVVTAVGTPPTVTLVAPAAGSFFAVNQGVTLSAVAAASTVGGYIPNTAPGGVTFLADGEPIANDLTAPFTATWTPTIPKSYVLRAQVIDDKGNMALSAPISVNVVVSISPTVTLTAPAAGTAVELGSSVPLTVAAAAGTGATVSRVDYFAGSTQVASSSVAPFSATWVPATSGAVSLTARVTDSASATATSSAVSVTVSSTGRLVNLVAPVTATSIPKGSSLYLRSTAVFTDGTAVSKVDFYVDGAVVGTATNAPYNFAYTYNTLGAHTVFARATAADGATTDSATATITVVAAVGTPPTVTLTAPAGGDTVGLNQGVTLSAQASASSAGSFIPTTAPGGVIFLVDGEPVATDLTAPYAASWTPTILRSYVIRAQAIDDKGNIALSAPLTVTAAQALPAVALTSPFNNATLVTGSAVTFSANASAPAGATVTSVDFLVNNTGVATVSTAPYSAIAALTLSGPATVAARVTDSNGSVVTTSPINVTFAASTTAPTVALSLNPAATTLPVGSSRFLTASPSSVAAIDHVDFLLDGVVFATVSRAPYTTLFTVPSPAGARQLTARVVDSTGGTGVSTVVNLLVTPRVGSLPSVGIVTPADGAFLPAGSGVALTAAANSVGGTIANVQYFANGTAVGTSGTGPAYAVGWAPATPGSYSLVAFVTDDKNNVVASPAVTVTATDATSPFISLSATPGAVPATVPAGSVRAVVATAIPQSGRAITLVEFFLDGTKVGESATAPYTYIYTAPTTAPTGTTSTLVARATDNAGLARDAQLTFNIVSAIGTGPTVAMVTPIAGTTVRPNSPVVLSATATDNDGQITSVQFYANGAPTGGASATAPYSSSYTPTLAGPYSFTAIATDDKGNSRVAPVTGITAAFATPTVTITNPANRGRVTTGTPVAISASAVGGDGAAVARVDYYLDSLLLGSRTVGIIIGPTPAVIYTLPWTPDNTQIGSHILTARVTDANGGTAVSSEVQVTVAATVGAVPSVSLGGVFNGATVQTLSVLNFLANAFDSDGTVTSVEVFVDSASIGQAVRQQASNVWRQTYDLFAAGLIAGSHTAYAIARDNSGNLTASSTITFNVITSSSLAPTVTNVTATPAVVTAGQPILLTADAADPDDGIAAVQFFSNGTTIGTAAGNASTALTAQVTYTPRAAGRENIYAIVTDSSGNTAVATNTITINITGNTAPAVRLVRPGDDSITGTVGQPIFLEATASDPDIGQTVQVDFLANGIPVATNASRVGTTDTYRATWTPQVANTYFVQARATDSSGAASISSPTRRVTTALLTGVAPSVSVSLPSFGFVTTASTVVLSATATDADGYVTDVEFFVAGGSIGKAVRQQSSNLFQTTTNFTTLGAGNYSVVAVARDNAGNTTNSSTQTITAGTASGTAPAITAFNITSTTISPGQQVQLTATALDADGSVSSVQYFANGSSIGSSSNASTSYLVNWTPSTAATYNVYAMATDNSSNTTQSPVIVVTRKPFSPILDDTSFVTQSYQDLVFTSPSTTELAGYSALMKEGSWTRAQMVTFLTKQTAFAANFNALAAYYVLMGEWPTYADFTTLQQTARSSLSNAVGQIIALPVYDVKWRIQGGQLAPTTTNFADSLRTDNGRLESAFINRLYRNAIGRDATLIETLQFRNNPTAITPPQQPGVPLIGRGYTVAGINTAIAELITIRFANDPAFLKLSQHVQAAAVAYAMWDVQPTAAQIDALAALAAADELSQAVITDPIYADRFVTFIAQPKSLTVAPRSGAIFEVTAQGAAPLAYQWLFNSSPLPGETRSFLSLNSVDTTQAGYYSVRVTSKMATGTSDQALLSVSNQPTHLLNISTRGVIGPSGGGELIGGFVLSGNQARQVLIRVVGPGLSALNVGSPVADPAFALVRQNGVVIAQNDNWGTQIIGAGPPALIENAAARVGAFPLDRGSRDAALLTALQPGAYTVVALSLGGPGGLSGPAGVGLIEVYDATVGISNTNKAINVSTRGQVGTGANVLIAGFVVEGNVSRRILIRGVGPGLRNLGVTGAVLQRPVIRLESGGKTIKTNNGWSTAPEFQVIRAAAQEIGAFPLGNNSQDAAMIVMLEPGTYTVTLSGENNTTGMGLVEVYDVDL